MSPLRTILIVAASMALIGGVGCESTVALGGQECRQLNEFGSGGCARLAVMIEAPEDLQGDYRISLLSEWPGGEVISLQDVQGFGRTDVRLDLVSPSAPVGPGDTASVWMIVYLIEESGTSTSVAGSDSLLHVVQFSSVGELPALDSVRLSPR